MVTDGERPVVAVREVGPRDGLQMAKSVMPTAAKLAWIDAVAASGVTGMEVASFVPPHLMPQMADAAEVTRTARQRYPALTVVALAPNLRGAQNAAAAGAQVVVVPVSASEAHSRANVRRSREEQVAEVARIVEALGCDRPRIEAGISTAFGCSLQGAVPEDDVVRLGAALAEAGADIVSLADTLGYAAPAQVRRLVRRLRREIGTERLGHLHLHDTLGTALANAYAGLEEGVRGFDGALGGLGGCPFAPGSVGNAATEDLVYLLESEGFDTGIDLPALIAARALLAELLPSERLHGRVAAAGIPRTYRHAAPSPDTAR
ncbi:hydroxymethylglutaryl-CoA lyase [Methylobacterium sp. Gmos1]